MRSRSLKRLFAAGLLLVGWWTTTISPDVWGQQETPRKAKTKITPAYPELARRMKITGVVKVQVTVAPNGTVKDARLMGGHPVLANAVLDVVKKWRFETGAETTENLEFRFDPTD